MPGKSKAMGRKTRKQQKKLMKEHKFICELDHGASAACVQACFEMCCPGSGPCTPCRAAGTNCAGPGVVGAALAVGVGSCQGGCATIFQGIAAPCRCGNPASACPHGAHGSSCSSGHPGTDHNGKDKPGCTNDAVSLAAALAKPAAPAENGNSTAATNGDANGDDSDKNTKATKDAKAVKAPKRMSSLSGLAKCANFAEKAAEYFEEANKITEGLHLGDDELLRKDAKQAEGVHYLQEMKKLLMQPFIDWLAKFNERLTQLFNGIVTASNDLGEQKVQIMENMGELAIVTGRKSCGTLKNSGTKVQAKDIDGAVTRVDLIRGYLAEQLESFHASKLGYYNLIDEVGKTLSTFNSEWAEQLNNLQKEEMELKRGILKANKEKSDSEKTMTEKEITKFSMLDRQHDLLEKQILSLRDYKAWIGAHSEEAKMCENFYHSMKFMLSPENQQQFTENAGPAMQKRFADMEEKFRQRVEILKSCKTKEENAKMPPTMDDISKTVKEAYDCRISDREAELIRKVITQNGDLGLQQVLRLIINCRLPKDKDDDDEDEDEVDSDDDSDCNTSVFSIEGLRGSSCSSSSCGGDEGGAEEGGLALADVD